ncbi:hypothetical protein CYMTET_27024 [Cymbomonas tetramitiformis]|uniref:Uncharacterized protein n=1 Tax=Cymbomonas tetramitiformis TaxID=36881 RepID=A0AAE0FQL6_9CHLO|nr:hypothetical protein CYMTET_27024 [Cymbomonas tetramitiformis]
MGSALGCADWVAWDLHGVCLLGGMGSVRVRPAGCLVSVGALLAAWPETRGAGILGPRPQPRFKGGWFLDAGVARVVEVFWLDGRVGEGASEEGATATAYFDGNPAREELGGAGTAGQRDIGEATEVGRGSVLRGGVGIRGGGGSEARGWVDGAADMSLEQEGASGRGWGVIKAAGGCLRGLVGWRSPGRVAGGVFGSRGAGGGGNQSGRYIEGQAEAALGWVGRGLGGRGGGVGVAAGLSVDGRAASDFPSLMVPKRVRGLFTEFVMVTLERMRVDTEDVEAYKLFFWRPRPVLQPVRRGMKKGVAQIIKERCTCLLHREWEGLYAKAPKDRRPRLAPATEETLRKLEELRPAGTSRRQDAGRDRRRVLQEQTLELNGKEFHDVMCEPHKTREGTKCGCRHSLPLLPAKADESVMFLKRQYPPVNVPRRQQHPMTHFQQAAV